MWRKKLLQIKSQLVIIKTLRQSVSSVKSLSDISRNVTPLVIVKALISPSTGHCYTAILVNALAARKVMGSGEHTA